MAEVKASSLVYGQPVVTKLGALLFTVTNVEVPATEEEYVQGGVELKPSSLGLTDGLVAGPNLTGEAEVESPSMIWCNPVIALKKETYEEGKTVAEGQIAQITTIKGKPFLRVYAQETAGLGKPTKEATTATKVKLGKFVVTVFAFGR